MVQTNVALVSKSGHGPQDAKPWLQAAEYEFRLANFPKAYRCCKQFVDDDAFRGLKDKKKHEAIKAFIRYGHHNRR